MKRVVEATLGTEIFDDFIFGRWIEDMRRWTKFSLSLPALVIDDDNDCE